MVHAGFIHSCQPVNIKQQQQQQQVLLLLLLLLYTVEKDLWYPHLDYAPGSIYSRQPNSMKHQQELLLLCV